MTDRESSFTVKWDNVDLMCQWLHSTCQEVKLDMCLIAKEMVSDYGMLYGICSQIAECSLSLSFPYSCCMVGWFVVMQLLARGQEK